MSSLARPIPWLIGLGLGVLMSLGCRPEPTDRHHGPVADGPVADGPVADGPVADGPVADGSVDGSSQSFPNGTVQSAIQPNSSPSPTALRELAFEQAEQKQYSTAARTAVRIAALPGSDSVEAISLAFEWYLRAGQIVAAESVLRDGIADLDPQTSLPLHRLMAQLLNSEGRRFDAVEHVMPLLRAGVAAPRDLVSLIDLRGPYQIASLESVVPPDQLSLLDLGRARDLYIGQSQPDAAIEITTRLLKSFPDCAALIAFHGRVLAETQRDVLFDQWNQSLQHLPEITLSEVKSQPEYWSARATDLSMKLAKDPRDKSKMSRQSRESLVRMLGEAILLDPTDRYSLKLMGSTLVELGQPAKAVKVRQTVASLEKVFRLAARADAESARYISQQMQLLVRPWESIAWMQYSLAGSRVLDDISVESPAISERRQTVKQWESAGSPRQIAQVRSEAMLGFDMTDYSLPPDGVPDQIPSGDASSGGSLMAIEREASQNEEPDDALGSPQSPLRFEDVAVQMGIDTSLASGYRLDAKEFFLYQANGGGLATLDYDLDGRPDLYVIQSGGRPKNAQRVSVGDAELEPQPNQLFRQSSTGQFSEISGESLSNDRGFGQGIAVGDVNQDGLPDLMIANIGPNQLLINQGDGTFRSGNQWLSGTPEQSDPFSDWTSSVAIADLDGDQLPDIFDVNYLNDSEIFRVPCLGKQISCVPQRFDAAVDRLRRCRPNGRFEIDGTAAGMDRMPNYGLGLVVTDFDGMAGNDVFVGNDGDLNHFWKSVDGSTNRSRFELLESAGISGCGVGASGLAQACMGIANGDFDRNGHLDLLITNFYNEPSNLFSQTNAGYFSDIAQRKGLVAISKNQLGFGIQAADFDNNGWLDNAVLNGHLYDASYIDIPFRMLPQILVGSDRGFSLQDPAAGGPFWMRPTLGRTLLLWDYDRDGRMDLAANHLDQPIAVLQNSTGGDDAEGKTASGHYVQLTLVGTASERGAIGARARIRCGDQSWTSWRTAGDGYMCSNDPVIHFGLGSPAGVDELTIDWPSGMRQQLGPLKSDVRYRLIEGQPIEFETGSAEVF